MLCRGNRTAERGWTGLQFGPEGPEFDRLYGMTKLPLNASLLPMWAPGVTDTATEMLKWQRARNFSKIHNMVDMACVCMNACLSLSWLQCHDIMLPADSSHDGGMVGVNVGMTGLSSEPTSRTFAKRSIRRGRSGFSRCVLIPPFDMTYTDSVAFAILTFAGYRTTRDFQGAGATQNMAFSLRTRRQDAGFTL